MTKLFKEFTAAQLSRLKKEYDPLKGKRIPMNQIEKMQTMLSKYSTDMLVKLANTDIPFIATAAKNIAVVKRGKKWSDFKTKLDMAEADELQCEACWDSHKQVGTKISSKTGKRVPNCVPKEELQEALNKDDKETIKPIIKQLQKSVKAHDKQAKQLTKDLKDEADMSKSQIKKVHDKADDLPKKDFIKRYGKDGDSVRYATATNMVKKKLGIGEGLTGAAAGAVIGGAVAGVAGAAAGAYLGHKIQKIAKKKKSKKEDVKDIDHSDVEEAFTKKDFKNNERDNEHGENAKIVVGLFGTPQDVAVIDAINARHKKQRYISREDQKKRDAIVNKYYGKLKEGRVLTNPEVATALRQYIAQRPFISNKKDYEELMKLSLKDMNAFNAKYKSMNTDSQNGVKSALAKKGLSSTLSNDNKPKGDQTMNESYKDKFNATMKKFGINSLDDLKSDEEKKKFFKAVDDSHDAKNEELTPAQKKLPAGLQKAIAAKGNKKDDKEEGAMKRGSNLDTFKPKPKSEEVEKVEEKHTPSHKEMAINAMADNAMKKEMAKKEMKMNAMKMPIQSMYGKMNAMKTGDDDLTPMNNMKLNAMIKDPHKSKGDDPKKDMNATYMKSDVRGDVKNGGGTDMSKVNDNPKPMAAMKKINAMYKTEKYLDEKPGSIQNVVAQMFQSEQRTVNLEDKKLDGMVKQYLSKGGVITKLPPALQKGSKPTDMKKHQIGDKGVVKSMKMGEVRDFISTYNSHFLTNFKAEEFIIKG